MKKLWMQIDGAKVVMRGEDGEEVLLKGFSINCEAGGTPSVVIDYIDPTDHTVSMSFDHISPFADVVIYVPESVHDQMTGN